MTVDELTSLCDALIGDLDLAGARRGNGVAKGLTDETYILLIRFLSGERPVPHAAAVTEIRPRQQLELVDDDVELPEDFSGIKLF